MRPPGELTPKGVRTSERILDAAIRCVSRDGVAASSMQRIADEAGVGKRAVVYYYRTREGLLDQVVKHVADRMLDQLESAVAGVEEPEEIFERGFEVLWGAVTTDRALLAAWLGLHAESVTNPSLRGSARYISDQLERIMGDLVDAQLARGRVLLVPREALLALVAVNVQGFATYYVDRGDSPALQAAIATFQRFLTMAVGRRSRAASVPAAVGDRPRRRGDSSAR